MAYYIGINVGDNEYAVTTGTTSTGKDIEVVVNDPTTDVPSVQDLLISLEKLENAILRGGKAW